MCVWMCGVSFFPTSQCGGGVSCCFHEFCGYVQSTKEFTFFILRILLLLLVFFLLAAFVFWLFVWCLCVHVYLYRAFGTTSMFKRRKKVINQSCETMCVCDMNNKN